MADGKGSGLSPLWLGAGAAVLVLGLMAGIAAVKPLSYAPPAAAPCEEGACGHEGAPAGEPEGVSHAAPAAEHAPEPASHEAAPPPHGE